MKFKLALVSAALLACGTVNAAEPTNQELLDLIKSQQKEIENLKKSVEEADEKAEASVEAAEKTMSNAADSKLSFGGYGELHYNNIEDKESIDFHRFVTFMGYEFNEDIRFFSELEVEHSLSGDGKPGEVELEQAYVEIDVTDATSIKSGLFLVPVGILNETHEPPTFYGVERNPVEKNIIPSTWWEAGAGVTTELAAGITADFAIHSGLEVPNDGGVYDFNIRSGRQKVAKANADSFAYTARIKYTAIPGLELAASIQHQTDLTQGVLNADANLYTAHAIYNVDGFGIRALYAGWDVDSEQAELAGQDKQDGFFVEPSYRFNDEFGVFARYSEWDNVAGNSIDTEMEQTNVGFNYWPHQNVVFKFDLERRDGAQDGDGFNLGVGYQF
ncbi:porin [Kangiella shandongensis]|uniref:porin n=1 Tax=Kangiella shandongensis TaxID=2763258 RepID=UPI001CBD7E2E|nr:porin [Kangiella shandongensis]